MIYTFPKEFEKPKNLLTSRGTLVYDPKCGNKFDPWWVILECDKDIAALYRFLFFKKTGKILQPPAFGAHISISRGVELENKELWGMNQGKIINFLYDPFDIATNGKHWWFHCYSDEILELRDKLGLSPDAHHKWKRFHLTFGKE